MACLILYAGCSFDSNEYVYRGVKNRDEQKSLIGLLAAADEKTGFSIVQKITQNLRDAHQDEPLVAFLTTYIETHSHSMYNPYWLVMLAHEYLKMDMPKMAAMYLERAVGEYADIDVGGRSVQYTALQTLIRISNNPQALDRYYTLLLKDFYDEIDVARTYFMRAQVLEKLGDWHLAIENYAQFLSFSRFDLVVPGIPDAYGYARKIVDYNASDKKWIFDSLEELVSAVTYAIRRYDYQRLERYRSQVNFFAMSWKQELSREQTEPDFELKNFMQGSRISVAKELDPSSTPFEAYLRTTGWKQYIRTWYLYFKKINFPADPSIHGKWEWAGIYYGEKQ